MRSTCYHSKADGCLCLWPIPPRNDAPLILNIDGFTFLHLYLSIKKCTLLFFVIFVGRPKTRWRTRSKDQTFIFWLHLNSSSSFKSRQDISCCNGTVVMKRGSVFQITKHWILKTFSWLNSFDHLFVILDEKNHFCPILWFCWSLSALCYRDLQLDDDIQFYVLLWKFKITLG